jgi:tripeptide aminopeptidase
LTSRVVDLFLELCAIPSPPGEERAVADRVTAELDRLGLAWEEDDAAERLGSSTGNIVCRLPGAVEGGVPLFLCAHLDTVPLDGALDPVIDEGGLVRNAGGTILGADNKSAVVAMLEAARRVLEEERRHAGIELVFTPQEEVSLRDEKRTILTCVPDRSGQGQYLLWPDRYARRWRWALRSWPDDDLGMSNHGASNTLQGAIKKCRDHLKARAEFLAQPKIV